MNEYKEFTAKTIEEALETAAKHFELSLSQLEWEIVSSGSVGLFRFIGAKKAIVRVRPAVESLAENMAALTTVVSDKVALRRARIGQSGLQIKNKGEKFSELKNKVKNENQSINQQILNDTEKNINDGKIETNSYLSDNGYEGGVSSNSIQYSSDVAKELVDEIPESASVEGVRLEEDPVVINHACEVLTRLIQPLDIGALVKSSEGKRGQGIGLVLISKNPGILIGRRGQNLEALQYITTRIVSHRVGKLVRVNVDTDGYRKRRKETLESLAKRIAQKAKGSGRAISMGPLNSQERRIIHLALKNESGVITSSRGRGDMKKVFVSPN